MDAPWSRDNLTVSLDSSSLNLTGGGENLTWICGEEADSEVLDLYRYNMG